MCDFGLYALSGRLDEVELYKYLRENLEQEKAAIASDIKAVYDEAEGTGLDKKVIRKIVSWRKKSDEERSEEDNLFQLYLEAIESLKNQRTITTDNVIKITA